MVVEVVSSVVAVVLPSPDDVDALVVALVVDAAVVVGVVVVVVVPIHRGVAARLITLIGGQSQGYMAPYLIPIPPPENFISG